MKIQMFVSVILLFCFTAVLLPQDKNEGNSKEYQTKIDSLSSNKGELLIKDIYKLGKIRGNSSIGEITIDALILYTSNDKNEKEKGLRININVSRIDRNSSFVDIDEIENLTNAISNMIVLSNKWKNATREPYTEVSYETIGNFKLGFYKNSDDMNVFASCGGVSPTNIFMDIEDLTNIRNMIERGLKILNSK